MMFCSIVIQGSMVGFWKAMPMRSALRRDLAPADDDDAGVGATRPPTSFEDRRLAAARGADSATNSPSAMRIEVGDSRRHRLSRRRSAALIARWPARAPLDPVRPRSPCAADPQARCARRSSGCGRSCQLHAPWRRLRRVGGCQTRGIASPYGSFFRWRDVQIVSWRFSDGCAMDGVRLRLADTHSVTQVPCQCPQGATFLVHTAPHELRTTRHVSCDGLAMIDTSHRYLGALPDHGRFGYSAITRPARLPLARRRAAGRLPGASTTSTSPSARAWARRIGPASPQPDVLNYSWREYGNRVGAWRCLELFDELRWPAAALINTALYDHCPELVAACVARGDELVGHGHSNAERQGGWPRPTSAHCWRSCRERIAQQSGQAPAGWLSPWICESRADARPAGRDRLPLHAELVPRRPAGARCARAAGARCGRCPTRRS